jgi:hypothetical protein
MLTKTSSTPQLTSLIHHQRSITARTTAPNVRVQPSTPARPHRPVALLPVPATNPALSVLLLITSSSNAHALLLLGKTSALLGIRMRLTRRSRAISYDRSLKRLLLRSRPPTPCPSCAASLSSLVLFSTTRSLCNIQFYPSASLLGFSCNPAHTYRPHGSPVSSTDLPSFAIGNPPKRDPGACFAGPRISAQARERAAAQQHFDFGCPPLRLPGFAPAGHDLHVKLISRACGNLP